MKIGQYLPKLWAIK